MRPRPFSANSTPTIGQGTTETHHIEGISAFNVKGLPRLKSAKVWLWANTILLLNVGGDDQTRELLLPVDHRLITQGREEIGAFLF